jgi:hypothetical protein
LLLLRHRYLPCPLTPTSGTVPYFAPILVNVKPAFSTNAWVSVVCRPGFHRMTHWHGRPLLYARRDVWIWTTWREMGFVERAVSLSVNQGHAGCCVEFVGKLVKSEIQRLYLIWGSRYIKLCGKYW